MKIYALFNLFIIFNIFMKPKLNKIANINKSDINNSLKSNFNIFYFKTHYKIIITI